MDEDPGAPDPVVAAGFVRRTAERLRAAGVPTPEVDAWALLEAASGRDRLDLVAESGAPLPPGTARRLEGFTARREAREPLQHIVGRAGFYGLELAVGPGVLVPRPETERLVEEALAALPPRRRGVRPRVLDVGTGSGAAALAVKRERPDTEVLGTDLSDAALAWARRNARTLGLPVAFLRSDLLGDPAAASFARTAAVLLSNPPYLPESDREALPPEVDHDPPGALFSGRDGLHHARALARVAAELLPAGATLLLELDPRNAARAAAELAAGGWTGVGLRADLAGRERFVAARRPGAAQSPERRSGSGG